MKGAAAVWQELRICNTEAVQDRSESIADPTDAGLLCTEKRTVTGCCTGNRPHVYLQSMIFILQASEC